MENIIDYIIENNLYETAVSLMDNDIREKLHSELSPCTEKEFLTVYMKEHKKKYNKEFKI